MKKIKTNNGITMISLAITIILMIILASVIITASVNGGILSNTKNAKNSVAISVDIEKIESAIVKAKAKDRNGKLTVEKLQQELNECKVFEESNTIIVKMNGNSYKIDENGRIEI